MSKNVFDISQELMSNAYPGRGIILGRTPDNKKNVIAYFIMGRSENSRNRVFTETEDGIRTEAFDPSKMVDPSLIIYHPVRLYKRHPSRYQRRPDRYHCGLSQAGQELL